MLVLTRRLDEGIVIQDDIVITVLAVEGGQVKLGIEAPRTVTVLRKELREAVRDQNLAAARLASQAEPHAIDALRRLLTGEGQPGSDERPSAT